MTTLLIDNVSEKPASHSVIGLIKTPDSVEVATNLTDPEFAKATAAALTVLDAGAGHLSTTRTVSPVDPSFQVIAIGLGEDPGLEELRAAAGEGVRAAAGLDTVEIDIAHSTTAELEAISEGALLAAYDFAQYREPKKAPVSHIVVRTSVAENREAIVDRANIVANAVNRVRDLVNTPANDLNPEGLAAIAESEATAAGCSVRVYSDEDLVTENLAGLIAVGKGSASSPRLVRIEWNPEGATGYTALVGKGITFDSGGYSLKPAASMVEMKTDMAGAATILEVIVAAAKLGLPRRIVAWMCLAENMVSGTAGRVDDVITYRNGKSVEINNTDAEGRLVLADGLIMAVEEEPDEVLDIATLTGAQMVALGNRTTAVMGTESERDLFADLAREAGEDAWAMPLPQHLRKSIDSDIADMRNSGNREGGMLVAGLFLKEFVGDTPWVHIDIAGPSFNRDGAWGYTPKGATGAMTRALLAYLENKVDAA